ncbi:hypothetical protein ABTE09_19965, partial [Acinetobacter baumannii]
IQGTDPTNLATVKLDLSAGAPGHKKFMRKKGVIIECVGKLLAENPHIKTITVCGHSLGGALAQDMLTAIMGAKMLAYLSPPPLSVKD